MNRIIILLMAAILPMILVAQPTEVAAKKIRATQTLQIDTAKVTAIRRVISDVSTHSQLPTSKSVYDLYLTSLQVTGVNTITELSALTTARSEQVAFVKDSLRGGTFVLKSAAGNTVDNGIVFTSAISGKVWVRQYDGKHNALWYGVKRDGTTDNTALYPSIFASMPQSSTLYFPSGTYKGDIVLNGRCAIEGDGLSTVLSSTTTGNAISITSAPNELGKMVIRDLKIIGYNGIVFTTPSANKWQFRDIDIEVSNIGVKKEQGNIYNTYENLTILGGEYGLYAVNSPIQVMHTGGDLWIKCRFVNSTKAGVYINDRSFGSGQLKFLNCFFEGNLGFAVFIKQFGAGRVVSAPSLKFVDCWNEANFILPNVTIDGVTYDSLNTVKVSRAVAVFDGSPCSVDARDSSFITFINVKTDGIENYVRTDNTSFVQYKDSGLSRTNEGNVLFDGLTAFETGNQNSAQVPNRKLRVNHPKTVKSIDFSSTLPIVAGSTINGGILYDRCQRYTLTGGTSILNLIPITSGKIGVWTIDVRNRSTATNFQLVSTLSLGTVAMANDTMWHTYAGIQINTGTGNAGINLPIGSGTIDLSAFQYLEFDDIKEAIEYWNSESYTTGKVVEVSSGTGTQDYVAKFTTPNTIGDSQIRDNGTAVGVGVAPNNTFKLGVAGQMLQNATNPYKLIQNGGTNFFVSGSSANITGGGANDYDAFLYGNNSYNVFTNSTRRLTVKGDGSIGFNILSPPPLGIQLQGLNSISLPATTGTTQNGLITRFSTPSTSAILDLGSNGGGGFWLQSTDNSTFGASYPFLFNPNGGNVGINTTSASRPLHVNGIARITGTGAGAATLTGRDASNDITNVGIGANLSLSSGILSCTTGGTITGGGSAGQMTFFSGASAINGSSRFLVDNVAAAKITLNGGNGASGTGASILFQQDGNNNMIFGSDPSIWGGTGSGNTFFQYGNNPISFATNSGRRLTILGNGNVGVLTQTPSYAFQVNGVSAATRFLTDEAGSHTYYESRRGGVSDFEISNVNGSYWHYNGTAYSFFIEKNTGNVGINTGGNALRPLHVVGAARITGSAGTGTSVMLRDASGDVSNATLGAGLSLSGGTLSSTATGTVSGTGTAGKVAYWNGTSALTSTANFAFDGTNLAVGTPTAGAGRFRVVGNSTSVCAQFDAGTLPNFGSQTQSTATTASGNSILGLDYTGTTTGSTTNYLHKLENNGTGSTILQLNTAAAGGSPMVQYNLVGGSGNWVHGMDKADANKFKIKPYTGVGTSFGSNGITITTAGLIGINNESPGASIDMDATTDGIALSSGNTANRPTSGLRWFRYNSSMAGLETRTIGGFWHVLTSANTATLTAGGALGSSPTVTVNNGTDMAYSVSLTVGTAPTANAVIFTRSFSNAWSVAPTVVFSAANQVTASEITKFYVDTTAVGSYTIRANGTLTAGTTYKLNVILQN